ncbi:MAG: VOC family protein [Anaerolineaceae bacterium]|nr:VOC family protein [Anaerolineaceae bacterium]
MNINKQIIFLPTNDLQKTTHFYKNLLKFELFLDQGDCVIFKTCENGYIGFCERPLKMIEGKIILTLIVDNVDFLYEKYLSIGNLAITPPTTNQKYRIYHFFIKDPNGYSIEFQNFLDEVNW